MSKKIGILYGSENTFPLALIERINNKKVPGIAAETILIDEVVMGESGEYAVIIDRISQDVPFYKSYLKAAALGGTSVLNNPFWSSCDEAFLAGSLARQLGIPVLKSVLLPSKERPANTTEYSFRNLAFPMAWENMFSYIGFPARLTPVSFSSTVNSYRVHNTSDLWNKHEKTRQTVMMLQEEMIFDDYFRCYFVGKNRVHCMPFEPNNPPHLRYATQIKTPEEKQDQLLSTIQIYTQQLNEALGYDFNAIEFGVLQGKPVAVRIADPVPDADLYSIGSDNFEWVVEAVANLAIEKAAAHRAGQHNLTWGTMIQESILATSITDSVTQEAALQESSGPKKIKSQMKAGSRATDTAKAATKSNKK